MKKIEPANIIVSHQLGLWMNNIKILQIDIVVYFTKYFWRYEQRTS
jgi:hypothetical protein